MNTPNLAGIFGLGTTELLVIGGIIILLFGAKKLPDLAKGLGQSIKEFKKASKEIETDDTTVTEEKKNDDLPKNGAN